MANQWNMPHIPSNAQGELHFDFPNAIKPPRLIHHPLAVPTYAHGGNENIPPPAFPHQWAHQPSPPPRPPLPARAPPHHAHTFVQYQGPGLPTVRHLGGDGPPLRAVPASAAHGNGAANPGAPVAYGYGGARQMPQANPIQVAPHHAGPFQPGPAIVNGWDTYPPGIEAEPLRTSRRKQSRDEREEEDSSSDESDRGKGKAKRKATEGKKRKRQPKKSEAKRGKARTARKGGVGSKSGELHRRAAGGSDDEIDTLSEAVKHAAEPRLSATQLKAAKQRMKAPVSEDEEPEDEDTGEEEDEDGGPRGLTEDEKLQAVEWLTTAEHYKNLRTNLEMYCITISQVLFEDQVSASQIARYWNNNAFKKYKAIRAQLPHTGGGDPDAARQDMDEPAKGAARPRLSDVTFTTVGKLSADSLLAFYNSKLYDLIDAVAHSDSAVERVRKFNSSDPISMSPLKKRGLKQDSPAKGGNSIDELFHQAFHDMSERSKIAQDMEKRRLELEMRRDEREEAERNERRQIRVQQERREAAAARAERWTRAMELTKSPIMQLQERGLKLIEELEQEEAAAKAAEQS